MKKQDFSTAITVSKTPEEVFNCINKVSQWWAKAADEATSGQKTKYEGKSTKLNDVFIMRSGTNHYSKQKLIEVIPNRKVVWLVTESKLNWIKKNKEEWTNTKMIFDITSKGDKTVLRFTHQGLIPEHECYTLCAPGWTMFIKERLFNFINKTKTNKMKKQLDFSYSLTVKASAKDAMKKINQVNKWWAKDVKGKAAKLNDKFSVWFGKDTYVDFKISELIPDKKVVWLVTDCNLGWIKNKKEWTGTEAIFTLTTKGGKTIIDFVHKGITPDTECYETCKPGWTHHLKDSLVKLIDEGKGFPE